MASDAERPKRVLFFSEAVTLAHFARPLSLAKALQGDDHDVFLAADQRYASLAPKSSRIAHVSINTIPSEQFARALAKGDPLYDAMTLEGYVEDDLAVIDTVKPDVIIGDFRLSLAVSAPLAGIPYIALINAYWSPHARVRYTVPDLPLSRMTGTKIAQALFDMVRPMAFAVHAAPLNKVRRRFGLQPIGSDLRAVYSWGDYTLYPDVPQAIEMRSIPPNHRFIGPVLWSPEVAFPPWWKALQDDLPVVYVTLGSSGRPDLLETVLAALANMPLTVIAATACRTELSTPPSNAHIADYLPGDLATERASLVICNGGSLTTYQAAAMGVPIIGLPSNMDQHLSMQAMTRLGVGTAIRSEKATSQAIRIAASRALDDHDVKRSAARAASILAGYNSGLLFREVLAETLR